MNFTKYLRLKFLSLYLACTWFLFLFLFNPHYVELTGTLETWFPYKGLIYYRDFAAFHFPLGRLILLPFHLLTNWNLEIGPFLGLVSGSCSLVIIYLFGKKYLSSTGTSLALFFFAAFFWYAATGILFFHEILIGLLLSAILLLLFDSIGSKVTPKFKLFSLGILIALAELSGQVATITLTVIIIIQLSNILFHAKKFFSQSLFFFLLGIIIPPLLLSFYFIINNAFGEFFYYNITYYLQYAGYKKDSLTTLPIKDLLAYFSPLIMMAVLTVAQYLNKKGVGLHNLILLILSLSTIPFILFSIYHPHHLNYALPILAICLGKAYDLSLTSSFGKLIFFFGSIYLIYTLFSNIIPWHTQRIIFPPSLRIYNDIYPDSQDPMKEAIDWVKLNTPSDTKILVVGDALFYLRSNRLPSARPSKSIPWGWEPAIIKSEIEANKPDYWMVDQEFTKRLIVDYKREDMVDFLESELDSCYNKKIVYKNWEIWEKICE